jgi:SAM-dependent methyltransferase
MRTLDIGCGSNKAPGAEGMDIFAYPGVDIVHNVQTSPWPVASGTYDRIICQHVIEHIDDVVEFMREIHRIAKNGATVEITTPHFSSLNSWVDPTHKKHLSLQWYKIFTEGYLAAQSGTFQCIFSNVSFGKSLRANIGKFLVWLRGQEKWEKNHAFIYPGMDITTHLRVVK